MELGKLRVKYRKLRFRFYLNFFLDIEYLQIHISDQNFSDQIISDQISAVGIYILLGTLDN